MFLKSDKESWGRIFISKIALISCFVIPVLLITSPNIIHTIFLEEDGGIIKVLQRIIFFLLLFLFPLVLFHKNLKLYLYLLSPFLIIAIFVDYLHIYLKVSLDDDVFMLLWDTNTREATEFLSNVPIYFLPYAIIAAIIYIICVRKTPKSMDRKTAVVISSFSILIFFSFPAVRFGFKNYKHNLKESTWHFYPVNLLKTFFQAKEIFEFREQYEESTKNFSFNTKKKTEAKEREIHLLVIGESSRRDHWGVYNYERSTSPYMSKRDLIVFTDATASGHITMEAVPIILTRGTARDFDRQRHEKGILHAFSEAGFKTCFIDAQHTGREDIDIHGREAQQFISVATAKSFEAKYEDGIPSILSKILKENKKSKIFIVIHTFGSHWRYDLRYPPAFDIFKPSMKQEFANSSDKSKKNILINTYDNTIMYSDHILEELIRVLDSATCISTLTYISDHGENLLDDERGYSIHAQATKETADIPLFIWSSQKYKNAYPEKITIMKENKNKKISSENMFYSVLDIADLQIKDSIPEKSFASRSFAEAERYMITEKGVKPYASLK